MKLKLFLIATSLGIFNFFLASSIDVTLQTSILTSYVERDSLVDLSKNYSLSGEISFQSKLPHGNLKIFLYPEEGIDVVKEISRPFPFGQALYQTESNNEGYFSIKNVEPGVYQLLGIIQDGDSYHPLEILILGNISPEEVVIDDHISIQVAVSFQKKAKDTF